MNNLDIGLIEDIVIISDPLKKIKDEQNGFKTID